MKTAKQTQTKRCLNPAGISKADAVRRGRGDKRRLHIPGSSHTKYQSSTNILLDPFTFSRQKSRLPECCTPRRERLSFLETESAAFDLRSLQKGGLDSQENHQHTWSAHEHFISNCPEVRICFFDAPRRHKTPRQVHQKEQRKSESDPASHRSFAQKGHFEELNLSVKASNPAPVVPTSHPHSSY